MAQDLRRVLLATALTLGLGAGISFVAAPAQAAVPTGLVDGLTLHLAPVVLGAGTPLFTGGARARWCGGA